MPFGPSAFEHRGVDHFFRRGAARRDGDQRIDRLGQAIERRVILVGESVDRPAVVIGDRQAEGFQPTRNRPARCGPCRQCRCGGRAATLGQRIGALLRPAARRADNSPALANSRTVLSSSPIAVSATSSVSTSGVLVTMIPALAGMRRIDAVIADAEIGDDFEVGQGIQEGRADIVRRPAPAKRRRRARLACSSSVSSAGSQLSTRTSVKLSSMRLSERSCRSPGTRMVTGTDCSSSRQSHQIPVEAGIQLRSTGRPVDCLTCSSGLISSCDDFTELPPSLSSSARAAWRPTSRWPFHTVVSAGVAIAASSRSS